MDPNKVKFADMAWCRLVFILEQIIESDDSSYIYDMLCR